MSAARAIPEPSRLEHLQLALHATQEILTRLEEGELRPRDLPALLAARLKDLLENDSTEPASEDEAQLASAIRDLDEQIMNWCRRALGETRDRLARARRNSAKPASPPPRLVSESA